MNTDNFVKVLKMKIQQPNKNHQRWRHWIRLDKSILRNRAGNCRSNANWALPAEGRTGYIINLDTNKVLGIMNNSEKKVVEQKIRKTCKKSLHTFYMKRI